MSRPARQIQCRLEGQQESYTFRFWTPELGRVLKPNQIVVADTETTLIDKKDPSSVPTMVLAVVFDGSQGWFMGRENIGDFLRQHPRNGYVFHNAAFDLKVIDRAVRAAAIIDGPSQPFDVYDLVDADLVRDTLILVRLLHLASEGHDGEGKCSLEYCANRFLGVNLPKDTKDAAGDLIRESFSKFLTSKVTTLPDDYLNYGALDSIATWQLLIKLKSPIQDIQAQKAPKAYGYAGDEEFKRVNRQYGPLTHHIQLRASIVADQLSSTGLVVDTDLIDKKFADLTAQADAIKQQLIDEGVPVSEAGSSNALQRYLAKIVREHPEIQPEMTATGKIRVKMTDLQEFAQFVPGIRKLVEYRTYNKLLSTYVKKLNRKSRVYGEFRYLKRSGRTSCCGGLNLQNLPKRGLDEEELKKGGVTLKQCLKPTKGHVFVAVDYSTIELVTLGWAWKHQLGFGSSMLDAINSGRDMHTLIASEVLGKPYEQAKAERNASKPISLGRPGGMGAASIQTYAKGTWKVELSEDEVKARMAAYETICPELKLHLSNRFDVGDRVQSALEIVPEDYFTATGQRPWTANKGNGWLGNMLLKVLASPNPTTLKGRFYSAAELDYFWGIAEKQLRGFINNDLYLDVIARKPSYKLKKAVQSRFDKDIVITATGRIRSEASYCTCRNGIMQGLAADGAILAMWKLKRAGYRLVNFIHDEIICEVPEDDNLPMAVADIEKLMVEGMQSVIPGAKVSIETSVLRSLCSSSEVDMATYEAPGGCLPADKPVLDSVSVPHSMA